MYYSKSNFMILLKRLFKQFGSIPGAENVRLYVTSPDIYSTGMSSH